MYITLLLMVQEVDMAGKTKKPVTTKKTVGKKPDKAVKKDLEPCDKAHDAETSRPMQEDGACDDGIK
jgi:hypothetical protein